MKLLFFIDSLGSGGAQRQMVTIAPLMKRRGIQVEFLCYHRDIFFKGLLDEIDINVHWIITSNPVLRIWRIRSFIRKGNYDAVVSFLETPDLLNCLAAIGRHKWKVITSERSAKEDVFTTWRGKLTGWMKRYSDSIVCNSENARRMWLKYYPQYEDKLKVIYNIVTLPSFTSEYVLRKDGKTHIVVVASYQYLKNPGNVVEAVNLLGNDEKSRLILDWYGKKQVSQGGTRAYEEAVKLVEQYGLQEVIHLNGQTSLVAEKMKEADVVGLFSKLEGLPNTICEAMTLCKPIIMSRVSDYAILVDEGNGILCNGNDIVSIKDALHVLLSQWSDKQFLIAGENSVKKAALLFEKERILNQWMKVIGL